MATAQYTPSPFPCSIVVVQTTGRRGKTFKFERKNWCVLGANKDCDIIVPFPGVAQLQALIHVKRNGVFLQGIDMHIPVRHPRLKKELLNEEEVMILPGDIFLLGNREFLIEYSAEDVCIETSDGIAQTLSGESSSSRKTPRLRRRRKSSIMVGEFDETYVLPTNGSEKLLSDYQLARVSKSEAEILPELKGQPTFKDDAALLQHESSQDQSGEEEMCFPSLSSDNSDVFSSEEGSVSRTINFDSTNEGSRENKNRKAERTTSSSARSKVVSEKKQRRKLIFDRLSKGLPATPRRRQKESTFDQHEPHLQTTLKDASCNGANIASGKENVPFHGTSKDPDVKKDKDIPGMKDLENAHSIRSPLANRVELENQASPPTAPVRTPASKGQLGLARARNTSAQTPRARSVAFAATIELAPGAHYSPFRPRKMMTKSGSATRVKRHVKEIPEKEIRSAPRSKRPSVPSSSTLQKEGHLTDQPCGISEPVPTTHQFQTAIGSQGSRTDTNRGEAKPVIEYEDDSNPPTPSSSEAENDASQLPTLSAPSPMARVGGALAGFLKRLSSNFGSDQEDDSSFETDSEHAHKRLSFSEDLNESREHGIPSTYTPMSPEPVMSSMELQELSQTVSPERRCEFVNQVLSAANDVREATNLVSNECRGGPLNSEEGISSLSQTWNSPLQNKEANACPKKLPTKPALPSLGPELLGVSTASESSDISVEEAREVTSRSDEENHDSANESMGSEVHSSIGSDNNDGPGCSRSTSLEVTSSESDVPELEVEVEILHNVNVDGGLDETDDEDAIERDYGDDPWDDLDVGEGNESDEREVAAVVLEHDGDIQNASGFGHTRVFEKKIESGFEQLKLNDPREEHEDSPSESISRNLRSTPQHSTDDEQRVSSLDQDGDVSDDFSASISDEISSSECDLSSASSTGTERTLKYDTRDAVQIASTPEKKTEDSSASFASPSNELEISKKELSRLKKDELKKRLGQRGLDVEGLKKDLVDRLAQAMTVPATRSEGGENLSEPEPQYHEKNDEEVVDLTNESEPSTFQGTSKRSEENIRKTTLGRSRAATRRLTRQSLAGQQSTASPLQTPKTVQDAECDTESKDVPDISQYRRRTMRELRQFLTNRGLDTQLKMRKDELIQHLISHSIGSDGQLLEESNVSDDEKKLTANTSDTQAQEKPLPKSSQKMTVAQIRTLLREQGQCQAGTKKTLLDRLTAHPERRTRSRRVMDNTSCALCKEGKTCEAAAKK